MSLSSLLARLFIVAFCIPFHEWAHCWMAHLLGDPTPEEQGRLTLNPLVHIDPIGGLLILIGGFGWGRAALVNPYRMWRISSPRTGMALTALAGPLSNILLAALLAIPLRLGLVSDMLFLALIDFAIQINVGLAAFNLLPIPPLDGSRILAGVVAPQLAAFIESLEPIAPYILIAALFILPSLGLPIVAWLILPLRDFIYYALVGG